MYLANNGHKRYNKHDKSVQTIAGENTSVVSESQKKIEKHLLM